MTRAGPEIRVVTHGGLPCPGRTDTSDDTIVVDPGATLAEVLTSLGIDRGLVGVAAMDGRIVQLDAVLQSDGVIHVYPIFGGG
jgi:sulfur carrier protein ThiS